MPETPKEPDSHPRMREHSTYRKAIAEHRLREPEFYRPLKGYINTKFRLSQDLDKLEKKTENETAIAQFKSEYGERVREFAFFPISGKMTSRLLVIDRKSETVVDTIGINPTAIN